MYCPSSIRKHALEWCDLSSSGTGVGPGALGTVTTRKNGCGLVGASAALAGSGADGRYCRYAISFQSGAGGRSPLRSPPRRPAVTARGGRSPPAVTARRPLRSPPGEAVTAAVTAGRGGHRRGHRPARRSPPRSPPGEAVTAAVTAPRGAVTASEARCPRARRESETLVCVWCVDHVGCHTIWSKSVHSHKTHRHSWPLRLRRENSMSYARSPSIHRKTRPMRTSSS